MGKPRLTTDWDALVTSAPVNTQAAKDAAAKGTSFTPRKELYEDDAHHSEVAPLPTREIPKRMFRGGEFKDLTGLHVGKLTVVGLAVVHGTGNARWVVKCACGVYEHRNTKTLKKPGPERAQCNHCNYVEMMRRGQHGVEFPKLTVRV